MNELTTEAGAARPGSNGTLLVRDEAAGLRPMSLAELLALGDVMFKSALFEGVRNASVAVVKIMAGAEMGFGPAASMADVHIIEGKPSVGAHLRAAAIKRSDKYDFDVLENTREACELAFYERSLPSGGETRKCRPGWVRKKETVRMTMKEAVDCGLAVGKDGRVKRNWQVSGDDMLFARCVSKGYRRYCSDLSGGVLNYDPDELDALPIAGAPPAADQPPAEPVSAPAVEAQTPALPAPPAPEPEQGRQVLSHVQMATIDSLVEQLGVSKETFAAGVRHHFGDTPADRLSPQQADQLIERLSAALAARQAATRQQEAKA